jgi:nitroimidazol reductase NimA-like FMN-containing flavoprotein (pyridoxamine 5'-phosphate oxidase superfamily)
LSVVVHGKAELFAITDPEHKEFSDYAHDVYVPRYGDAWKNLAYSSDVFFARIDPESMFTFQIKTIAS